VKLRFEDQDDRWLLCPVCDHNAIHIDAVRVAARKEDRDFNEITVDAVTGRVTTHGDDPAPLGEAVKQGRRHRIVLMGWCEQRHGFAIVFTQHKGTTFVEVVQTDYQALDDCSRSEIRP
jgi:hypothetical protein